MDFKVSEKELIQVCCTVALMTFVAFSIEVIKNKIEMLEAFAHVGTIAGGVGGLVAAVLLLKQLHELRTSQRSDELDKQFRFLCESIDKNIEKLKFENDLSTFGLSKPGSRKIRCTGYEVIIFLNDCMNQRHFNIENEEAGGLLIDGINKSAFSLLSTSLTSLLKWAKENGEESYLLLIISRYTLVVGVLRGLLSDAYWSKREEFEDLSVHNRNLFLLNESLFSLKKIVVDLDLAKYLED